MLLEEWLVAGSAGSPAPVEWLAFRPPTDEDEARLLVHGHCHSRALTGDAGLDRLLGVLPQTRVERVDAGCCGMAGSFGYEPEHHELSMAIGAQRLFPAIRALGDAGTVVAAGTSCRHQIRDGTGRGALHPAEVLAARLERGTDRT